MTLVLLFLVLDVFGSVVSLFAKRWRLGTEPTCFGSSQEKTLTLKASSSSHFLELNHMVVVVHRFTSLQASFGVTEQVSSLY